MTQEELEGIADLVVENDLFVISDEVYECLTYEGKHVPFSSLDGMKDRTVMLNGFSKAYAMTGLRLGFAMGSPEIIHLKEHFMLSLTSGIPAFPPLSLQNVFWTKRKSLQFPGTFSEKQVKASYAAPMQHQ